jgi:hypothetical protein
MSRAVMRLPVRLDAVTQLCGEWEPPTVPHCSDCAHARVSGATDSPTVSCYAGHGKDKIDLWRLIRRTGRRGFRSALTCSDFSSMSDDA